MAFLNPNEFQAAQTEALGRLRQAKYDFLDGVAPRLSPEQQRAVFNRVMTDPALFDRVLKKYGVGGMQRWQNAMTTK